MLRRSQRQPDPFGVLGLPADADVAAILEARRALAKIRHPDAGGSVEAMQQLNAAVDAALAVAATGASGVSRTPTRPSRERSQRPRPDGGVRHDHPSFTIEALPVEAFHGLLVAASELGEIADDDPPYLLEVVMDHPYAAWCRLELVPDAGAATVSITTARVPGHAIPDVDEIRDAWVEALNRLDWVVLGSQLP